MCESRLNRWAVYGDNLTMCALRVRIFHLEIRFTCRPIPHTYVGNITMQKNGIN